MNRAAASAARLAIQLGVIVVAIACWQLWARAADDQYFPEPSSIISAVHHQWFSGPASHLWLNSDGIGNLLPSLGRAHARAPRQATGDGRLPPPGARRRGGSPC